MAQLTREIISESNRIGVQFLLADLRMALTFLDVALVTATGETHVRNLHHARRVYETVLRLLTRVVPSAEESAELAVRIAELKRRLEDAGCAVES
jgi:UDP-N-acetylglucosamine enolpyruvyl transferase